MCRAGRGDASIQQFLLPILNQSPKKRSPPQGSRSEAPLGDGFTAEEVESTLKPIPADNWHPDYEYADSEICALTPGPHAVTFMGRIANVFDVANSAKTPRSAKGCVKLCIKDAGGAITVRLWYASRMPLLRLGTLVSIWTNHVSNGENGSLSSSSAPLFASLFPERDRNCHLMVHRSSDVGLFKIPLEYREGIPLNGLMTLQNFIDGGYDVTDAKILVIVKSIGSKKKGKFENATSWAPLADLSDIVARKDQRTTDCVNLKVQDDTAEATLGLWGTLASSPFATNASMDATTGETAATYGPWKPGETVLLIQAPGWKIGRHTYLSVSWATVVDVDPHIPDAEWLRRWALRQKSREAINLPFPEDVFDKDHVIKGSIRCLFTIAELDEFVRCAPNETFQGYLSLLITETKLLDLWRRQHLLTGECCNVPTYANALVTTCKGCDKEIKLRLNPRIVGQCIDETAVIATGKLLFSDEAWHDLLGRPPGELLQLCYDEIKYLSDRLLFCRINVMFGWIGEESKAGGRICVLGVCA